MPGGVHHGTGSAPGAERDEGDDRRGGRRAPCRARHDPRAPPPALGGDGDAWRRGSLREIVDVLRHRRAIVAPRDKLYAPSCLSTPPYVGRRAIRRRLHTASERDNIPALIGMPVATRRGAPRSSSCRPRRHELSTRGRQARRRQLLARVASLTTGAHASQAGQSGPSARTPWLPRDSGASHPTARSPPMAMSMARRAAACTWPVVPPCCKAMSAAASTAPNSDPITAAAAG